MSEPAAEQLPDAELIEVPADPDPEPADADKPAIGRILASVFGTALLLLAVAVIAAVTFLGPWGWALIGVVLAGLVVLFLSVGKRGKAAGGGDARRGGLAGGRARTGGGGRDHGGKLGAGAPGGGRVSRLAAMMPTASGRAVRAANKAARSASRAAHGDGKQGASGSGPKSPGKGVLGRARSALGMRTAGAHGRTGSSIPNGIGRGGGSSASGRSGKRPGSARGAGLPDRVKRALGIGGSSTGKDRKHRRSGGRLGRILGAGALGTAALPLAAVGAYRAKRAAARQAAEDRGETPPRRFRRTRAAVKATRAAGRATRDTWRRAKTMTPKAAVRAARMAMNNAAGIRKAGGLVFGAAALGFAGVHKAAHLGRVAARAGFWHARNITRKGVSRTRVLARRAPLAPLAALTPLGPRRRTKKRPPKPTTFPVAPGADIRARLAEAARKEATQKTLKQRVATAGPMTRRGTLVFNNAAESDGMMEYRRKLAHLASELQEMEEMARQFQDSSESEKPLNGMTLDAIGEIPTAVTMLREIVEEAGVTFDADHAADIERLENPRVNEPEWDASRNDA